MNGVAEKFNRALDRIDTDGGRAPVLVQMSPRDYDALKNELGVACRVDDESPWGGQLTYNGVQIQPSISVPDGIIRGVRLDKLADLVKTHVFGPSIIRPVARASAFNKLLDKWAKKVSDLFAPCREGRE